MDSLVAGLVRRLLHLRSQEISGRNPQNRKVLCGTPRLNPALQLNPIIPGTLVLLADEKKEESELQALVSFLRALLTMACVKLGVLLASNSFTFVFLFVYI